MAQLREFLVELFECLELDYDICEVSHQCGFLTFKAVPAEALRSHVYIEMLCLACLPHKLLIDAGLEFWMG